MARKIRPPEIVEEIKNNIIKEALELIHDVGFNNMSMRKLASRVGMTATNLYYYYANQDEIYLNIQIKGFLPCCKKYLRIFTLQKMTPM